MTAYPESLNSRDGVDLVKQQARRFTDIPAIRAVMDAVPSLLLIINRHRQIVFANEHVIRATNGSNPDFVLGKRPGELLNCEHAGEGPAGCGTGEHCSTCGAAQAIRDAELGEGAVHDARIHQTAGDKAMDFRVSTTPLNLGDEQFSVVALSDVSHENRRRSLERIFFHDLLNTLGALTGYIQLLNGAPSEEVEEITSSILRVAQTLVDEIHGQRDLASAESNELAIRLERANSRDTLKQLVDDYQNHPVANGRKIVLAATAASVEFSTDPRLMNRILANMLKNALEATPPGGRVDVDCRVEGQEGQSITFSVANPSFMPRDVQLQVFHRAFSTKGAGRGLGTYSMKLLGEKYLGGTVSFTSSEDAGTTFRAAFPLNVEARQTSHTFPGAAAT